MVKRFIFFTLILAFVVVGASFAGTINLPQTGQTKCYDTSGVEIPCAGTGQDGDIQAGVEWPSPRFTVNEDTTIKDNLTGLVWARDGNIMPTRDPGWDTDATVNDGAVTWQHALDYVAKLNAENYLGHSDWRLPNVNELESLINAYELNIATWLNTQGFINVQGSNYWSSTTYAYYPDSAWFVSMWNGAVNSDDKSSVHGLVWPVRAGQSGTFDNSVISLPKTGQTKCYDTLGNEIPCSGTGQDGEIQAGVAWPDPRFSVSGDCVTDNLTGLMWTKDANLPNGTKTWQQALDYVAGMNAGTYPNYGYTDWRLPNRKEPYSLMDFSQYNPPLSSGHPFTNVQASNYWSSTTFAYYYYTDDAWVVYMWDGVVSYNYKPNYCYMWPVRGGQIQPAGCSTWSDVIGKYNTYVSGQASWNDVITCYGEYAK